MCAGKEEASKKVPGEIPKLSIETVEEMKKEAAKVSEDITKLRARVQTQHLAQDHLKQYSPQRECTDIRNTRV